MSNRQIIQPDIEPTVNGERGIHPLIARIRRKLGLTYIVDNPFQVPVAQSTAADDSAAEKKSKK